MRRLFAGVLLAAVAISMVNAADTVALLGEGWREYGPLTRHLAGTPALLFVPPFLGAGILLLVWRWDPLLGYGAACACLGVATMDLFTHLVARGLL